MNSNACSYIGTAVNLLNKGATEEEIGPMLFACRLLFLKSNRSEEVPYLKYGVRGVFVLKKIKAVF